MDNARVVASLYARRRRLILGLQDFERRAEVYRSTVAEVEAKLESLVPGVSPFRRRRRCPWFTSREFSRRCQDALRQAGDQTPTPDEVTIFLMRRKGLDPDNTDLRKYIRRRALRTLLAFSRDLDVQYKTAFVLAHKLREAMASGLKALRIGGEGQTAEIDGAYFGGHIRPANLAADRIDRRLAENRPVGRKVVVAMRERGGRTLAQVFPTEADALATIRHRIAKGTIVHADESSAWDKLHANFEMVRINHLTGC